ncbi:MAG: hypothetical protein HY362_03945 [Candidatus Aenigmarchaeota archaeon]|nr:hypothetical protein [Candidatus Aenigmarchaeota archaeon]
MPKTNVALLNRFTGQISLPPMERGYGWGYSGSVTTGNYTRLPNGRCLGSPLMLKESTPAYLKEMFAGPDRTVRVEWAQAVYLISHLQIPRYRGQTWEASLVGLQDSDEFGKVLLKESKSGRNYGEAPEHLYGPLVHSSGIVAKKPTITVSKTGEVVPTVVDITRTMGIRGVASVKTREGIIVLKGDVTAENIEEELEIFPSIRSLTFGDDGWASPRISLESGEPVIVYDDALSILTHYRPTHSRLALTRT